MSSTDEYLRPAMMLCASVGPMPGTVSSSSTIRIDVTTSEPSAGPRSGIKYLTSRTSQTAALSTAMAVLANSNLRCQFVQAEA